MAVGIRRVMFIAKSPLGGANPSQAPLTASPQGRNSQMSTLSLRVEFFSRAFFVRLNLGIPQQDPSLSETVTI